LAQAVARPPTRWRQAWAHLLQIPAVRQLLPAPAAHLTRAVKKDS